MLSLVLKFTLCIQMTLFFLKDRSWSCASSQARSALLVSLEAPCRDVSVSREGLVSSGCAGAELPGGDPVNQAGWQP